MEEKLEERGRGRKKVTEKNKAQMGTRGAERRK
jgi:hypothetical protein